MTVAELIEILKQQPQDAAVCTYWSDDYGLNVEEVTAAKLKGGPGSWYDPAHIYILDATRFGGIFGAERNS